MLFHLLPLLCENRNRELQNGLRAKSNKDTPSFADNWVCLASTLCSNEPNVALANQTYKEYCLELFHQSRTASNGLDIPRVTISIFFVSFISL